MAKPALALLITGLGILMLATQVRSQTQSAQKPAFEVASIKRSMPGQNGMSVSSSGNRFRATNAAVKSLILNAYPAIHSFQISGGPNWVDSDGFDIEAVADAPLTGESVHEMLRVLLKERFKLEVHTEMKEMPLYALVVGKDGPKLQPAKDDEPTMVSGSGRGRMNFQRVSLSGLADNLSFQLDRIVIDQTGLTGKFSFKLEWTPDSVRDANSTAPSLFTAVQEQLGLRLEATKLPVEVLMIDHAEKPGEN